MSDTGGVLARRLIERVNHHRAKHGLGSLRANPQLDAAAQAHSETMLKGQCFEHVCAGEADLGARIERAGYAYRVVAENIAAGFEDAVTVVDRWMRSESHRENMLMPGLSEAGFGYVRVPRAADPLELGSYWTLDLGTPLHARRMPVPPPPSRRPSTIGAWEKTMGEAAKPGVRERSGPKAAEREIPGRPAGSLGRSQPVKRDR